MVSKPSHTVTIKHAWLADIFILTIVLLLFYSCWLGSYPLFTPDEGRYSEVAREMITSGDFITPHVNGIVFLDKPILYYWLQALALKIFGVNEWAVRFFPALIGVIGCIITYISGRILFNRRAGLLSAIILATSPLFFGTAHYADLNLEVAVFISASLMLFISGIALSKQHHPHARWVYLSAYFFAALAILTKGLIGIVFPCLIAGSWILLEWRFNTLRKVYLFSGLLLISLIVAPWYLLVQKANPAFFHYFFIVQQVTRFMSEATFNNPTPVWFYLPVVLIGFFPWSIFLIQALISAMRSVFNKDKEASTLLYLLLWVVIVFGFFSIPQSKTIGYIVPLFPALALLTGNFLATLWEKPRQLAIYISLGIYLVSAVLLATLLFLLPTMHWIHFAPEFNWHLSMIAMIFLSTALLSLLTLRTKHLFAYFAICVLCSVCFLLTLTQGATHLNQNSAKPILLAIKSELLPDDIVVNYYNFFQDAPMYLNRKVLIVANWSDPSIAFKDNWQREMWYGKSFHSTKDILINENQFWQLWNSDKRVFVLMNNKYFNHFTSQTTHYYDKKMYNDIIAVSNRPAF